MRLAVISDIHGNTAALNAVLEDIDGRDVDQIVNLGDCFSGPLDARGTAEVLAGLSLVTVRGNHDRALVDRPKEDMGNWEQWIIDDLSPETLDWCRSLPLTCEVNGALLCHATPEADDENWLDRRGPEARLIARDLKGVEERAGGFTQSLALCGHTHAARSVRLPDGRRIVNPGSVGCPAYFDNRAHPPFLQQTGTPDAQYAIVEWKAGDWSSQLLSVPYDASAMIALALEKGAENWAKALQAGWFA